MTEEITSLPTAGESPACRPRHLDQAASSPYHTLLEDMYALVAGALFAALGLALLSAAKLSTGGVAGMALLGSYLVSQPVGWLFMLINIPFFLFGCFFMGLRFTVKSLIGSAFIMGILKIVSLTFSLSYIHPALAALAGGTMCGMAALIFARHDAGLGGTGILTLWIQRKFALNAGKAQIVIDSIVMLAGLAVASPERVGWSILSAIAMCGMVIAWHRPGRYNTISCM